MQRLLDTASSQYASGFPEQSKIFEIKSGPYTGRVIVIYPQTTNAIVFRWADFPYETWSAATTIVTNSADYPASAFMDSNFNLYLAYTVQTTLALNMVKLTFANGSWSVGSAQVIVNVGENYYPSILKDSINRLWVSWTYYDSVAVRYYIQVKSSTNDGVTWGTGPSDLGTALNSGSTVVVYSQLIFLPTYIYCIFSDNGNTLTYKRFEISGTSWSTAVTIYSGSNISYNFQAAISSDNRLGVVFSANSTLLYKEYDQNFWSGVFTLDSANPITVSLQFFKNVPYVFYAKSIGTDQNQTFYTYKSGESFITPVTLDLANKSFDKVFCFDQSAGTQFQDKTTEASNTTTADVFHTTSNGLVKDVNDILYLGMDNKFNLVRFVLSTSGITGQVSWQYWNGNTWFNFTPNSGAYHLDSSPKMVILWQDLLSAPADWQQTSVNSVTKFWVRALVTTGYTTAPVGTQITAVGKNDYLDVA